MLSCVSVLIIAFIIDVLVGDPVYRLHPVRIIGNLISFLEKRLYGLSVNKIFSGFILTIAVILIIVSVYLAFYYLLDNYVSVYLGYLLSIYAVYSCISLKDLIKHSQEVVAALNTSLKRAQEKIQAIVGRNAALLNKDGIIKATIECIAESFVDGILSPLFWFTIGAILGNILELNPLFFAVVFTLIQRVVNTIDSMIGYKNNKYILFGRFGATFDDVLNFIPARLSIIIISVASAFLRLKYSHAFKTALRDRLKHASPNSAHSEAAVAGALGIQLGGPTIYLHGKVDKPFLGDKINNVNINHISIAGKLIAISSVISLFLFSCIMLLFT